MSGSLPEAAQTLGYNRCLQLSQWHLFQFTVSALLTDRLNLLECHISRKPDLAILTSGSDLSFYPFGKHL